MPCFFPSSLFSPSKQSPCHALFTLFWLRRASLSTPCGLWASTSLSSKTSSEWLLLSIFFLHFSKPALFIQARLDLCGLFYHLETPVGWSKLLPSTRVALRRASTIPSLVPKTHPHFGHLASHIHIQICYILCIQLNHGFTSVRLSVTHLSQ